MRVPRDRVGEVIDRHGDLGASCSRRCFAGARFSCNRGPGYRSWIALFAGHPAVAGVRHAEPAGALVDRPGQRPCSCCPARLGWRPPRRHTGRAVRGNRRPAQPVERAVRTGRRHHRRAGLGTDVRPDRDRCGAWRAGRCGVRGVGGADHGGGRCGRRRWAGVDDFADRELSRLPGRCVWRGVRRAGVAPGGSVWHPDARPPPRGRSDLAGRSLPGRPRRRLPAHGQVGYRRHRGQLPAT